MAGLLDFLQSASNSAASNVSAPVDGIAWLLRKAGLDVGEPVGGSDWMQRQGLTRPVKQGAASLAGETAGLLSPMLAAAKAPQIARGLLSLDDHAMDMARKGIEGRMVSGGLLQPATVWHGSPHKFDKFDSSKIGTGEGAQAYGHGLYLAESDKVANEYATMFNKSAPKPASLMRLRDSAPAGSSEWKHYDALLNEGQSNLYKVDLPDEQIAKMLDWDKPLSQQAPEVQAALSGIETNFPTIPDFNLRKWMDADPLASTWHNVINRDFGVAPDAITSLLQTRGVPGIKYLDGGSRPTGGGTSNYVVFPRNEGLLKILERNGQPLK